MNNKPQLARLALEAALKTRQKYKIQLWEPVGIYDLAQRMGIEVRFLDAPSLEEIYFKTVPRTIIVSALRPPVRQTYNCAHGIGHSVFNHGDKINELMDESHQNKQFDPEEFLADAFAGFLLMPKTCVDGGFASRGIDPASCTEIEFYSVSCWLAVGYTTLIDHMTRSLRTMKAERAKTLGKFTPKRIRTAILHEEITEDLIIVDTNWVGRAIDAQVGDLILVPRGVELEGQCVAFYKAHEDGLLFRATIPGKGRFFDVNSGWASYVRVARRNFVGRAIFRHEEDPDYESTYLH